MKFDTVRICGVEYKIVAKTNLEMPGDLGQCHSDIQELWLSADNTKETNINTLLHECMHAISDAYDLDMNERQINVGATALIAFARDNPRYAQYFFGVGGGDNKS